MTDESKLTEGEKKAQDRKAAGEQTEHERAAEAEAKRSSADRAAAFVASYANGLAHGAPRTAAEFAELKVLLGVA